MNLPSLVWADFRTDRAESSPVDGLSGRFRIQHVVEPATLAQSIEQASPLFVCFEYDYPNLPALKVLRATKQTYPSLPILMLTVHHSEALAIWAFRTRVWDFLVKPLTTDELSDRIAPLLSILELLRQARRENAMPAPRIPPENRFGVPHLGQHAAQTALAYMHRHYAEPLRLKEVAGACQMNHYEFSRAFKRSVGLTFREYLCRYRLERSLELLGNPHATVSEIACAVGLPNLSHFTRTFRQRVGITPSQYRHETGTQKTHRSPQQEHSSGALPPIN
ncbi:helix-turn-helix transcriptional regulator [Pseudomonas sp. Q1-7]|uniref:helix-turn-helix transcriptional regulator n=1 Tax=Pseudomonas sp. Q1-7 TaxID=3020843 RepID=UPI00230115B0|nr:DNA-binding response regulator [Pseudomonas sp. Q1-7]